MGGRDQDEDGLQEADMIRTHGTIAALALLTIASCTPRSESPQPTHTTPDQRPRGNMDSITALKEVCELLTRDALSPAAAREGLRASEVAWVRAGRLITDAADAEPNHVELELPAPIEPATLERAFGAGTTAPRLHPESAREVLYYPAPADDRHHSCAIIARVVADGVRSVAVRRDPRL